MKNLRKVWYLDRFFIIFMTLLLLTGCFVMLSASKQEVRERIVLYEDGLRYYAEHYKDDAVLARLDELQREKNDAKRIQFIRKELEKNVDDELITADFLEVFEEKGMVFAFFVKWALLGGLFVKWIVTEWGRKKEFRDSLPVSAADRMTAQIMEVTGLTALAAIAAFAGIRAWGMRGMSEYFQRETGAKGQSVTEYLFWLVCLGFAYVLAHTLFIMFLSITVGRIETLLPATALLELFFVICWYVDEMYGFPPFAQIVEIMEDMKSLMRGSLPLFTMLLLVFCMILTGILLFLAGKKDCSGRRIFAYRFIAVFFAIVLLLDAGGLVELAMDDIGYYMSI